MKRNGLIKSFIGLCLSFKEKTKSIVLEKCNFKDQSQVGYVLLLFID